MIFNRYLGYVMRFLRYLFTGHGEYDNCLSVHGPSTEREGITRVGEASFPREGTSPSGAASDSTETKTWLLLPKGTLIECHACGAQFETDMGDTILNKQSVQDLNVWGCSCGNMFSVEDLKSSIVVCNNVEDYVNN